MRKLANLYLLLFLVAAFFRLSALLFSQVLGFAALTELSGLIDLLALLLGLLVYLCMAFDRHLPKLKLLPLIAFQLWGTLAFWPLPELLGAAATDFLSSIGQLLLGGMALVLVRVENGKSWLFRRSQFAGPGFSWRNLFKFGLLNIVLLPLVLLILGFSVAANVIELSTTGFVRLKPNGLFMVERVYRQGPKTIRLAGMIHLGQQAYYDELIDSMAGHRTLILAEGVSDETQRLKGKFSYAKLAELLGLASQEQFPFQGRLVDAQSLDRLTDVQKTQPDILRADVDLKSFDARTIKVLNALGKYLLNADSFPQGLRDFNRWANQHITPEINRVVMNDLLEKRNQNLLGYLPKALRKYDTLVIPWGALHMAGIERGIQELDFSDDEVQLLLGIAIVAAIFGGIAGGWLTDRYGPRRVLFGALYVWIATMVGGIVAATTGQPALAWAIGPIGGLALGSTWASDRVFMARISPPRYLGEFYGLYATVGRFATVLGPLMWGIIVNRLNLPRVVAMAALVGFIVAGRLVLGGVGDQIREWGPEDLAAAATDAG